MKNPFLLVTLLASVAILFGCQTGPKISSEFDPQADFSTYRKFVLLPLPTNIPGGNPGAILRTGKIIEQATADALALKGFERVEAEEADFAVRLSGKVVPKVDVSEMGYSVQPVRGWYGYYRPYYIQQEVYVDHYEEGTLIIEIYDVSSRELTWVGWGVARKPSEEPDSERVRDAVNSILADFPPI